MPERTLTIAIRMQRSIIYLAVNVNKTGKREKYGVRRPWPESQTLVVLASSRYIKARASVGRSNKKRFYPDGVRC